MNSSPYLQGNFAPVDDERTVADLPVTGAVPPALAGRYLRTGPNPFDVDVPEYHWFTGDGMVHGVDLHDGQARWYRNRWVRSPMAAARLGEEAVPTAEGGFHPGSGNTNVFHHAGRIWAATEGSLPYELTPELGTVAARDFGGPLPYGASAHPKFDPDTNELHMVSYGFVPPYLRYHVVDTAGRLVRTTEVEMGGPTMVHDMGLTATRVVLFDLPVQFSMEMAQQGRRLPYRWDPDYRARVGLLPRAGTGDDVVWVDVEPCMVYHPLNAYDDGETVVVDLAVHPRAFANEALDPTDGPPTLQRWTIDPVVGKVGTELIDERCQEFPRADERRAGRPHRFGYTLGTDGIGPEDALRPDTTSRVLKHDLVAGRTDVHELGPGCWGSEFVFVPESADAGEDEGWLLGFVYDAARGGSDLVILDAHDFGGDPVAAVHLPVRVPQGFHGNWIPDAALA